MFCEHLADADDAALMRLVIVYMLRRHPFGGVSFSSAPSVHKNSLTSTKTAILMDGDLRAPQWRPVSDGAQMVTLTHMTLTLCNPYEFI